MPSRNAHTADKIRDDLEIARKQFEEGLITRVQHTLRTARLMRRLKQAAPPRQRIALT